MRALIVDKSDSGVSAKVETIGDDRLPAGEAGDKLVTVAVSHTTVNYKDGLCLTGGGGLVRTYPHVPGIDFAGTVEASDDPRYKPGDQVVLTGWRVGEVWWGGYADKARVKGDWLVPLPEGLTPRQAMAIGTAGLTAMLSVLALEGHGLAPGGRPVLVTGASGGVGSVAVAILAQARLRRGRRHRPAGVGDLPQGARRQHHRRPRRRRRCADAPARPRNLRRRHRCGRRLDARPRADPPPVRRLRRGGGPGRRSGHGGHRRCFRSSCAASTSSASIR